MIEEIYRESTEMEENKNVVGALYDKFFRRLDCLRRGMQKEDDEELKTMYKEKIDELESFIDELDSKISNIIDEEYQKLWGRFSTILKSNRDESSKKRRMLNNARIHELDAILNVIESIIYNFTEE